MKPRILLLLALAGCTIGDVSIDQGETDPDEVKGAGGRDLTEYWPEIDIPLSQNTRMLSFEMMRNEVQRATGRSWVINGTDQWEANRIPLGGADYQTVFAEDLTPSQQRMVLWRRMAFQVCGDVVAAENGAATRTVFTVLDPGAALTTTAPGTADQVRALFRRFFLSDPTDEDIADSVNLLATLNTTDAPTAWRGLCTAYLGSMRFVTY
ncbi:MAG TPA: hypothetical protein VMZ28_11575 [Kofleriaceae bacterium]|nr:hypothetical protein [Kofleriaceae bacterium]